MEDSEGRQTPSSILHPPSSYYLVMKPRWTENLRSPLAIILFVGTAAAGLTVDLWSKAQAVTRLSDGNVIRSIPGLVHFTYTENHGAVSGRGQGQQPRFLAG